MALDAYRVITEADRVLAYSHGARLPFGVRGKQTPAGQMRAELEQGLRSLRAEPGQVLHATLISPAMPGENVPDTENVLLYNLEAPSAFASSAAEGLRYERLFDRPSEPLLPGAEHQHVYEVERADASFRHWRLELPLAELPWVEIPRYGEADPPTARLWLPLRRAMPAARANTQLPEFFALRLELRAPTRNAAPLVKKATDAVVSANHFQSRAVDERALAALVRQLALPAAELEQLLRDSSRAALGPLASLVEPWGKSMRWNPADERIVAFEPLLRESASSSWALRGSLHGVAPAAGSAD